VGGFLVDRPGVVAWPVMSGNQHSSDSERRARRAAKQLEKDPRVRLVYLFGSAADQAVASPRDIDLAILTRPPLSLDERLRLRADLVAGGVPGLDLVSLSDASVTLAHEVADHGICLFARSAEEEVAFVTRARARFWDFAPYLAEQWRAAGERLEHRRHGSEA